MRSGRRSAASSGMRTAPGTSSDRIRDHIKKAPPRKERFDLNEAINEVIVIGAKRDRKNGVSVQTRLAGWTGSGSGRSRSTAAGRR